MPPPPPAQQQQQATLPDGISLVDADKPLFTDHGAILATLKKEAGAAPTVPPRVLDIEACGHTQTEVIGILEALVKGGKKIDGKTKAALGTSFFLLSRCQLLVDVGIISNKQPMCHCQGEPKPMSLLHMVRKVPRGRWRHCHGAGSWHLEWVGEDGRPREDGAGKGGGYEASILGNQSHSSMANSHVDTHTTPYTKQKTRHSPMAQEEVEDNLSGIGTHRLLQETPNTQPLGSARWTSRKAGGGGVRVAGAAAQ